MAWTASQVFRSVSVMAIGLLQAGCEQRGGTQQPVHVGPQEGREEVDYLVYFPIQYDARATKWPLVLFLHGAGQCGTDIEQVKKHGLPQCISEGEDFPFLVVSPQCRGRGWDIDQLTMLLDDIVERYDVDLDRVYVTGLSMGGSGTWRLAAHSAERFAAIAPICGGGDAGRADQLAGLPIWAFHGAKDDVVPVSATREMVAAVEAAGGRVRYTEYPDAKHDCWTQTYDNPELYAWLLGQRRRRDQ